MLTKSLGFILFFIYLALGDEISEWNEKALKYKETLQFQYYHPVQGWVDVSPQFEDVDGKIYLNYSLPLSIWNAPQKFRKDAPRQMISLSNLATSDTLSFQLQPFKLETLKGYIRRVHQEMSFDECTSKGGFFTKKKKCRLIYVLDSACLKVSFNSANRLKTDVSYGDHNKDGGGCYVDSGIESEYGRFQPGHFTVFKTDGEDFKKEMFNWEEKALTIQFADFPDLMVQKELFQQWKKEKNDEL